MLAPPLPLISPVIWTPGVDTDDRQCVDQTSDRVRLVRMLTAGFSLALSICLVPPSESRTRSQRNSCAHLLVTPLCTRLSSRPLLTPLCAQLPVLYAAAKIVTFYEIVQGALRYLTALFIALALGIISPSEPERHLPSSLSEQLH